MRESLLFLVCSITLYLTACNKSKEEPSFFTFGKKGHAWTYEIVEPPNYWNDSTLTDTAEYIIINEENGFCTFNTEFNFIKDFYIDQVFGEVISKDPTTIDLIVTCSSVVGDSYSITSSSERYGPKQKVVSTDYPIMFKGEELKCYKIDFVKTDHTWTYYVNRKYGIVKFRETICPGGGLCYTKTYRLIALNF
jgi:hypothetical protein